MDWTECETLALPLGPVDSWYEGAVSSPAVVPAEDGVELWFMGEDAAARRGIGRALWGGDPCFFERPSPILGPGAGDPRPQGPTVVVDPGGYSLWYGSAGPAGGGNIWYARIGGDGAIIERPEAAVLRGQAGWEHGWAVNPVVVHDGQRFHMWYEGGSNDIRTWRIGHARSSHGDSWEKSSSSPVLSPGAVDGSVGVFAPTVVYHEDSGTFEMWYSEISDAPLPPNGWISYATSMDGELWCRRGRIRLAGPSAEFGVFVQPTVILDGETYHMWFATGVRALGGIAYATAQWTLPRASLEVAQPGGGTVRVDAVRSQTPATRIVSYEWDFGDGSVSVAQGAEVQHTYAARGVYEIKLKVTDSAGEWGEVATKVEVSETGAPFRRADSNDDGAVDLSDAVHTLNWLFLGGPAPGCIAVANTNGDDTVDLSDSVWLLNYLFLGGPPPVAPFPECGPGALPGGAVTCETPPASC